MDLLAGQTANTTGAQTTTGWNGGEGTVVCEGTFDGATVTLECKAPESSEWVACGTETTFTEAGVAQISLAGGFLLRGSVSNVGTTSVTLRITRVIFGWS